jgi:uncharacterized repeat protein (TIGR01451 family)
MKFVFPRALLPLILGLALTFAIPFVFVHAGVAATTGEVDLVTTLNAPDHIELDATFVVNLAYENAGDIASPEDTYVRLTLPDGVQFVQAVNRDGEPMPPDDIQGSTLTWNVGALPAGECINHILVTEKVDAGLPEETELVNTAEIASSAAESDLTNNTASVTSLICDMAGSTKQVHAGEVLPGDVVTYTITLNMSDHSNLDGTDARLVTLTDTLPGPQLVRFLAWFGPNQGEVTGEQLSWQGQVRAGEPLQLQYRIGVMGDVISGTHITNGVHLAWQGGEMDIDPVTTTVVLPPYAHMFGVEGGAWQNQYGVDIEVPPHAISETTRFEFHHIFTDTHQVQAPYGWMFAHRAFELTAYRFGEINEFGERITLRIHFEEDDFAGLKRNTLRLWYRNSPGEPWAQLGEPVASGPGYLEFETTHFTQFALFAEATQRVYIPYVGMR